MAGAIRRPFDGGSEAVRGERLESIADLLRNHKPDLLNGPFSFDSWVEKVEPS